jgi:hypothetical protein
MVRVNPSHVVALTRRFTPLVTSTERRNKYAQHISDSARRATTLTSMVKNIYLPPSPDPSLFGGSPNVEDNVCG